MRTTTYATKLICDRCQEQVNTLKTFYGEKETVTICLHAEEIDLCLKCVKDFREFMKGNKTK